MDMKMASTFRPSPLSFRSPSCSSSFCDMSTRLSRNFCSFFLFMLLIRIPMKRLKRIQFPHTIRANRKKELLMFVLPTVSYKLSFQPSAVMSCTAENSDSRKLLKL